VSFSYYLHDGLLCRVEEEESGDTSAEAYLSGEGYVSIGVSEVLFYGEAISEERFKAEFTALILTQRRKIP
jgi:hypothetical protein